MLLIVAMLCSFTSTQPIKEKDVYQKILSSGIKYPEIALAQSILESGHFKSNVARTNNNLFGMRMPTRRKTTAIGKRGGYATYKSWQDSVEDYKLWQDMVFKKYPNMTKIEFKKYVSRIYSTTSDYMTKVNSIIRKNKYEEEIIKDTVVLAFNDTVICIQ